MRLSHIGRLAHMGMPMDKIINNAKKWSHAPVTDARIRQIRKEVYQQVPDYDRRVKETLERQRRHYEKVGYPNA